MRNFLKNKLPYTDIQDKLWKDNFSWLKFGKVMTERLVKLNTRNLSFLHLINLLRLTSLSLLKSIAILFY